MCVRWSDTYLYSTYHAHKMVWNSIFMKHHLNRFRLTGWSTFDLKSTLLIKNGFQPAKCSSNLINLSNGPSVCVEIGSSRLSLLLLLSITCFSATHWYSDFGGGSWLVRCSPQVDKEVRELSILTSWIWDGFGWTFTGVVTDVRVHIQVVVRWCRVEHLRCVAHLFYWVLLFIQLNTWKKKHLRIYWSVKEPFVISAIKLFLWVFSFNYLMMQTYCTNHDLGHTS